MTHRRTPSKKVKWIAVVAAAALHPLLLCLLFPVFGERSNLVVVIAPLVATLLFSWRIGAAFALLNAVVTAVVLTHLADAGPEDGPPKALVAVAVVTAICFGVDRLKRFAQKTRSMKEELDRLRGAPPPPDE
jgi:hypothetical protein